MSESFGMQIVKPEIAELAKSSAKFAKKISFEAWADAGRQIAGVANCSSWWIGDWLNAGIAHWGKRDSLGKYRLSDAMKSVLEATELAPQTLHEYSFVARRITSKYRFNELSYSHHREAALAFEDGWERCVWLRRALKGDEPAVNQPHKPWTVSQLRKAIRQELATQDDDKEPSPDAFILARINDDFARVIRRETGGQAFTSMPKPRLRSLLTQLQPTVKLIQQIESALSSTS